jgi:GT2 family glycosyltransferase
MPRISVVTVTFNRLEKLQRSVAAILSEPVDELVVVNNACTDGTREWLDSLDDARLKIIHLEENSGGAGGFYHGFLHVMTAGLSDWLVCHDDDAWPQAGALDAFRRIAPELAEDVAGVAAAVYLPNGDICEMNRPSFNPFRSASMLLSTFLNGRAGFHVDDATYHYGEGLADIDCSSFVGCFLRVSFMRSQRRMPRKELFIYADDIIYTFGIKQAGMRHLFAPDIIFIHDCETLEETPGVYTRLWKTYYTYRNGLELYRLLSGYLFPLVFLAKLTGWLMKSHHYPSKTDYLRVLAYAVKDGLTRNFSRRHAEVLQLAASRHPDAAAPAPAPAAVIKPHRR